LKCVRAITTIVWCALAPTLGCRQIVGFDDESSESERPALPPLPFIPDPGHAQSCETCATERCSAEREACEDDSVCRALLRCQGTCSNPACRARCGSFVFRDDWSWFVAGNFEGEESPLLTNYVSCIGLSECASECNTGRNWDCIEDPTYRWPRDTDRKYLDAPRLRVQIVNFFSGNGVPARVSAIWGPGQSGAAAQAQSDVWGQAELALPPESVFRGFLEVESDERGGFRTLVQGPTIFRPTRWTTYAMPVKYYPSQPGRASIWVSIYDCLGFVAPGISFESPRATGEIFYSSRDTGSISLDADRTNESGSGGIRELVVDSETYTVIAKRNGKEVARRSVVVRADWATYLSLDPREAE
jgi:hypothetical protein